MPWRPDEQAADAPAVVTRRAHSVTLTETSHGKESSEGTRTPRHREGAFTVSQPADQALDEARQENRAVHGWQIESRAVQDRKSTRLNSSHMSISYAVFCLKKKKKKNNAQSINMVTYR